MRIQLKQPEIIQAITNYLVSQGIVVFNKDIQIVFTAGRKGSGLSAEININDVTCPLVTEAVDAYAEVVTPVEPATAPANLFN
jgi:hypothetical protein